MTPPADVPTDVLSPNTDLITNQGRELSLDVHTSIPTKSSTADPFIKPPLTKTPITDALIKSLTKALLTDAIIKLPTEASLHNDSLLDHPIAVAFNPSQQRAAQ